MPSRLQRAGSWITRHAAWVKWPVALALLGALFYFNREALAGVQQRRIAWGCAAAALVLTTTAILLTFFRWWLLLWGQEFDFRIRDALRLGFLGYLFNYVGPGAVGGDLVKAVMVARRQSRRRTLAVATIVLDRVLGLLALFMVGAFVSLFQSAETSGPVFAVVAAIFWIGAAAGLLGLGVMLHPATPRSRWLKGLIHLPLLGRMIGELLAGIVLYQARRRILVLSVAISLVGHLTMLSAFYFAGLAFSEPAAIPDYTAHLLFMPAAELAAMVPIVPGGVGALEGAIEYFYRQAGAPDGIGLRTGICYRVISIVIAAIGAVYYFSSRQEITEAVHEAEEKAPTPSHADGTGGTVNVVANQCVAGDAGVQN